MHSSPRTSPTTMRSGPVSYTHLDVYKRQPEEWTFGAPLLRARRYYAARLGAAALEGRNPEELTDAACRRAFYSFALDEVRRGEYAELDDGMVVADLPALPCNVEQTRAGRLYTDALWPVSREEGRRCLLYTSRCV